MANIGSVSQTVYNNGDILLAGSLQKHTHYIQNSCEYLGSFAWATLPTTYPLNGSFYRQIDFLYIGSLTANADANIALQFNGDTDNNYEYDTTENFNCYMVVSNPQASLRFAAGKISVISIGSIWRKGITSQVCISDAQGTTNRVGMWKNKTQLISGFTVLGSRNSVGIMHGFGYRDDLTLIP